MFLAREEVDAGTTTQSDSTARATPMFHRFLVRNVESLHVLARSLLCGSLLKLAPCHMAPVRSTTPRSRLLLHLAYHTIQHVRAWLPRVGRAALVCVCVRKMETTGTVFSPRLKWAPSKLRNRKQRLQSFATPCDALWKPLETWNEHSAHELLAGGPKFVCIHASNSCPRG